MILFSLMMKVIVISIDSMIVDQQNRNQFSCASTEMFSKYLVSRVSV